MGGLCSKEANQPAAPEEEPAAPEEEPEAPVEEPDVPAEPEVEPEAPVEEPAVEEDVRQIVVRKEIRKMPADERARFIAAVKKLMEGEPGQSEWHRLAGYHGWPSEYCSHRQEAFPGWHRAYLLELENALREADKALGGDGNVALPYWDWTDRSLDDLFPEDIRKEFPRMPDNFFEDPDHPLQRYDFDNASDRELKHKLRQTRIDTMVVNCLLEDEHFKHASASWSRDTSVESPHDQIHVAVGWPMTSVAYAAFNPIFWLHHCNVDRIYEKYIEMEKDSHQEFMSFQNMREEQGEANLYENPYEPFKHPVTGEPFMPSDQFDTRALGFVYDELPPTPADQMREFPTLILFAGVDVVALNQVSYELHCFLVPNDVEEVECDLENQESWAEHELYAGWTCVFGGKGEACNNCKTTKPVNRTLEITQKLRDLGKRRGECSVKVLTVSVNPLEPGQTVTWWDDLDDEVKNVIPAAVISGPMFDDMDELQEEGYQGEEARQLQKYLAQYGWYEGEVDADFGPKTADAVKRFQEFFELEVDGIAGPITKGLAKRTRFDAKVDVSESEANYQSGDEVRVWVGTTPGYMDREAALEEINIAFTTWGELVGVKFIRTEEREAADVQVMFTDQSRQNAFLFDGPGGVLAKGEKDRLEFDASERWLTQGQDAKDLQFFLLPVAIHEVGHVLGLEHSNRMADVMAPYYFAEKTELTENDKNRMKALYGLEEAQRFSVISEPWKLEVHSLQQTLLNMQGAQQRKGSFAVFPAWF